MPRAGFLALLGWYVAPGFFDRATCNSIRREMQNSPSDFGSVLNENHEFVVDESKRKVERALVSEETRALVTSRLMATMPSLEKHFGMPLTVSEPLSFLMYKPGFFYGRHTDANRDPKAPAKLQARRVSVSLFLNGEGNESEHDTYSGGSLAFSGNWQKNSRSGHPGIPLTGEEGLLLGFRADWPHEVLPVQRGTRYSIVTWFA
jgi:predicted 2-oxoglutarate/Fe(II)-dependent dioxygenase YbiX